MPATPKSNYAFIDSQNLHLGISSLGWSLDYKKFRLYLKNKLKVTQAFIFIGLVENNQDLYTALQQAGYILVFKPTIQYFQHGKKTVKGNVDAELVLHASAIEYKNYDQAVLVTGDGDFACLAEFLTKEEKLLNILTPNGTYSKLLKGFSNKIIRLDQLKSSLEKKNATQKEANKKTSIGGRSKP